MTTIAPRPTAGQWLQGARPRTLPAAVSPVLVGSGLAYFAGGFSWPLAAGCLVVSLALQVGVNYANDYSDGIRGTDAVRVGPLRLVGSGVAAPTAVKRAAMLSFAVAALAGLGVVLAAGQWWLLGVGAAAILAAWYYTGGARPYGYRGLGELSVFVFFGLVAVGGTTLVQLGRVPLSAVLAGVGLGALAAAILVANNLRDRTADQAAGKRTLATRIGDRSTRLLYAGLVLLAVVMVIALALTTTGWALLGLAGCALLLPAVRAVLAGAEQGALIGVLAATGRAELAGAVAITIGLVLGRS